MKEVRVVVSDSLYRWLKDEAIEKEIKVSELVRQVLKDHFEDGKSRDSVLLENNFFRTTLIMEQLWYLFESLEITDKQKELIKANASTKIHEFYEKRGLVQG